MSSEDIIRRGIMYSLGSIRIKDKNEIKELIWEQANLNKLLH